MAANYDLVAIGGGTAGRPRGASLIFGWIRKRNRGKGNRASRKTGRTLQRMWTKKERTMFSRQTPNPPRPIPSVGVRSRGVLA